MTRRYFSALLLLLALMGMTTLGRPAQAATASLEYAVGTGYGWILEACYVTMTSQNSRWNSVDFHCDRLGYSTNTITVSGLLAAGAGTFRCPSTIIAWVQFYDLPTGNYNLYAVAHGQTGYPPNDTIWHASTGGTIVTLN